MTIWMYGKDLTRKVRAINPARFDTIQIINYGEEFEEQLLILVGQLELKNYVVTRVWTYRDSFGTDIMICLKSNYSEHMKVRVLTEEVDVPVYPWHVAFKVPIKKNNITVKNICFLERSKSVF